MCSGTDWKKPREKPAQRDRVREQQAKWSCVFHSLFLWVEKRSSGKASASEHVASGFSYQSEITLNSFCFPPSPPLFKILFIFVLCFLCGSLRLLWLLWGLVRAKNEGEKAIFNWIMPASGRCCCSCYGFKGGGRPAATVISQR